MLTERVRIPSPINIRRIAAALFVLLIATAASGQARPPNSPAQTGEFDITLTLTELAGADSAHAAESVYSPDEPITWTLYVPDSYRPENPAGLMIYISPTRSGKIPQKWKSVMDKYNLIWVAANDSGNRVLVSDRATYALLAPTLAETHYKIDQERIYLSGFSGGGKVAGKVAAAYPFLFKGAIFICGIETLGKIPPNQLELFKQNHYVFVTGTMDQALGEARRGHSQFVRAGVANSKLMVIPNMFHKNPDRLDFDKAIRYLDSRLPARVPVHSNPKP